MKYLKNFEINESLSLIDKLVKNRLNPTKDEEEKLRNILNSVLDILSEKDIDFLFFELNKKLENSHVNIGTNKQFTDFTLNDNKKDWNIIYWQYYIKGDNTHREEKNISILKCKIMCVINLLEKIFEIDETLEIINKEVFKQLNEKKYIKDFNQLNEHFIDKIVSNIDIKNLNKITKKEDRKLRNVLNITLNKINKDKKFFNNLLKIFKNQFLITKDYFFKDFRYNNIKKNWDFIYYDVSNVSRVNIKNYKYLSKEDFINIDDCEILCVIDMIELIYSIPGIFNLLNKNIFKQLNGVNNITEHKYEYIKNFNQLNENFVDKLIKDEYNITDKEDKKLRAIFNSTLTILYRDHYKLYKELVQRLIDINFEIGYGELFSNFDPNFDSKYWNIDYYNDEYDDESGEMNTTHETMNSKECEISYIIDLLNVIYDDPQILKTINTKVFKQLNESFIDKLIKDENNITDKEDKKLRDIFNSLLYVLSDKNWDFLEEIISSIRYGKDNILTAMGEDLEFKDVSEGRNGYWDITLYRFIYIQDRFGDEITDRTEFTVNSKHCDISYIRILLNRLLEFPGVLNMINNDIFKQINE